MATTLRERILADAAALLEAMTSLCLEYQSYLRQQELPLDSHESNLGARLRLAAKCREKFDTKPYVIARRLQMAGYDAAANALRVHARVVHRFSLIEITWDEDSDSVLLNVDVSATHDEAVHELESARKDSLDVKEKSDGSAEEQLGLFIDAADMADNLYRLARDYLLYFEGWLPAGYDEDESSEDRMLHVTWDYDNLPIDPVVHRCDTHGLQIAAVTLQRLSRAVSAVVHHLPPTAFPSPASNSPSSPAPDEVPVGGEEIDVEEVRNDLDAKHDDAINALLQLRDALSASTD